VATDSQHDYYAVLGVHPEIDFVELRRVWRRLVRRWHPDYAGPDATATFQNLSAAYRVLSDPIARAAYDRQRGIPPPGSSDSSASTARGGQTPGVMLRRLCGPLNSLIACGVARPTGNGVIELFLRAEEASSGGMVTISMRVPIQCPACAGNPLVSCSRCANSRRAVDLFSAWLAVPPGITDGTILTPSADLPGMLRPVTFRVRLRPTPTPK
jgi:curved DNA-binding protein CbpA